MKARCLCLMAFGLLALTTACANPASTTSIEPTRSTAPAPYTTPVSVIPSATAGEEPLRYDTRWTFGDVSVTPSEASPGQGILVKVYLSIPDVIESWGDVTLWLDGAVAATQHLFCYGDEVILAQFNITIATTGRHELRVGVEMQDHPPGLKSSDDIITYVTVKT